MELTDFKEITSVGQLLEQLWPLEQPNLLQLIATDSRRANPGGIFLALPHQDIEMHVKQAVLVGVKLVVTEDESYKQWKSLYPDVNFVKVENVRLVLVDVAKYIYPKLPPHAVAVTGTSGKSSTVHLARQLWVSCGLAAASLGTLGLVINNNDYAQDLELPPLTSLDTLSTHKVLNYLADKGVNYLAFEASSHGLDQYRQHGVAIQAAGFTNLSHDHLDYHGNLENYFAAKAKLFTEILGKDKVAVLNRDSLYFEQLVALTKQHSQRVISYSLSSSLSRDADLLATNICQHLDRIEFDLTIFGKKYYKLSIPLIGIFQLENLLCAMGMVMATGIAAEKLVAQLPNLTPPKGRMELVGSYNQAAIYVDYCHKPDALEKALKVLAAHKKSKLWLVFGCGGNRDANKRPQMGKIANLYADKVIVTDDNPRFEEAGAIRRQILNSCPGALEIADRKQAIHSAIAQLKPGDILLVAGKGHETGQIVGDKIWPFEDQQEIRAFLS